MKLNLPNKITISNVSFIGVIPRKLFPISADKVIIILRIQNTIINITTKYVENFFITLPPFFFS